MFLALNLGVTWFSTRCDSCRGAGVTKFPLGWGLGCPPPFLAVASLGGGWKGEMEGRRGVGSGGLGKGPLPPSIQFKICSLISWWSRREFRKYIFEDPPPNCSNSLRALGRSLQGPKPGSPGCPAPYPRVTKGLVLGRPKPSGPLEEGLFKQLPICPPLT